MLMLKRLLNRLRRWRGTPQSREQTPGHAIYLKNSEDFETQKLAELSRNYGKQDYDKIIYGVYRSMNGHRNG